MRYEYDPRADRRHAARRCPRAVAEPRRPDLRQARGPEPRRVVEGPHRARRWSSSPRPTARCTGRHDPRAVVGQHRHRSRARGAAARLQAARRDAGERVDRAAPAARDLRRRDHALAGRRGEQRRRSGWRRSSPPTTRRCGCCSSTATRRTRSRTTRAPAPRSGATAPRSTCSSPASARAARSWASGRYLKEQKPAVQVVAVEPPAGELVQGLRSLDDGFVPPIFDPAVLDRKFIVRPRESIEWVRRLLDDCGVFAGISSGAAVAGAAKMADDDGLGHDRDPAARRRLEVPVVGCVDRRPRRRRRARHPHQLLVASDDGRRAELSSSARPRSCARGGLVAFPPRPCTGSVPTPRTPDAVRRLFAVKGRPADHPVIVHLADRDSARRVGGDGPAGRRRARGRVLARSAHPGRARASSACPTRSPAAATPSGCACPTSRSRSRCSREFGGGVAAPSANRFGRVSPTTAADVRADLGDDVDLVLDGGPCRVGVESTIVDCTGDEPAICALGGVPRRAHRGRARARVAVARPTGEVAAPGTLAAHYAPQRARRARRRRDRSRAIAASLLDQRRARRCPRMRPIPRDLPPRP